MSSQALFLSVDLTRWHLTSHPRLTVDNHMLKQIVSLYPFSAALRSEAKQSLSSVFLCRTASPTLLSSSPQTPPLFSRGHATLGKPVQDLTTMTNLPSIIPLAMSDDNEGTPEYDVITDLWCTKSYLLSWRN